MIIVTNLKGEPVAINDALIERVEGGGETRIILTGGARYVVAEPMEEVVRRSREDRAMVQALAQQLLAGTGSGAGERAGAGVRAAREALRLVPETLPGRLPGAPGGGTS